ncbi:glycosyltransferase [Chryseolinea soli]|uniref:Glycosyltransferase n=1 Tax=Chryseolinea soli TaxID=2321403 RepID=A0A385SV99_9BACT|nr:glycosyltransferase [Chryseolinea soli]AYB33895.1 glycosyltransferase [Chryseolinea soli]
MKKHTPVKAPSRLERLMLQVMIIFGLLSMLYFVYNLLQPEYIGHRVFYWLLILAIAFNCLKVLHEWYHYFHIRVPDRPDTQQRFTVDILTTFCPGEPYEMIEETLRAIQAIRYPHTTYLGDEGNDPYIKELCDALGVVHVTRNTREDAKAGNINNILKQATGELCVVLDPDHVPVPEFLDSVVPYFIDPQIGYVQVVQAYSNLDESLVAKGAAQQTFQFYGPMMMTMNQYGTVMAIGANCTFRRSALDSIGGHAAGLAEDMHTAMQLHARGWRSVYVPEVLTRGLVPSTLSAYYKQQLKWARGTFELLFTTYPRLFTKFTWRQRLHYGILPFHYFSGVIFLINFIVPVVSLTLGIIPLKVDLVTFAIVGFPFVVSVLMIRQYVQRWVMEEEERGFHVVGGILLIGTWWIYMVGLVYTIVRKKVPYIPTPKETTERDSWSISIPNIIVGVLSLLAIVYGLYIDWNPYSIFMAGVTSLNVLFMTFMVMASRQPVALRYHPSEAVRKMAGYLHYGKRLFWLFRHQLYFAMRGLALPAVLAAMAFTGYVVHRGQQIPDVPFVYFPPEKIFYNGIFQPVKDDGLTSLNDVAAFEKSAGTHFDLLSFYIPWGVDTNSFPDAAAMQAVYDRGSIPFITWEPWVSHFPQAEDHRDLSREHKALANISKGLFDDYILKFALQLKSFHEPVFLRFAHEFDNPAYPWSGTGQNTPAEFRQAWIHVFNLFQWAGATNVIWVWSPWKAENATAFFPGTAYVDWLSITGLDYSLPGNSAIPFDSIYAPFHALELFRSGVPVMVAEMGTLNRQEQEKWFRDARSSIDTVFNEIEGCILFNSAFDDNVVPGVTAGLHKLDWSIPHPVANLIRARHPRVMDMPPQMLWEAKQTHPTDTAWLRSLHGMNFSKGKNWFKNFHALTRKELRHDIGEMKALGVTTIKRYGPGVYDKNILSVAAEAGMKIHYNFWIDDQLYVLTNSKQLNNCQTEILAAVERYKNDPNIIAWNLDNLLWKRQKERYPKPELFFHQSAYMHWLNNLVHSIKKIDPYRPVTLDLPFSETIKHDLTLLQANVHGVDAFGVVIREEDTGIDILKNIDGPLFLSAAPVSALRQLESRFNGGYIAEWQDLQERNIVTLDGLVDHWGRPKPEYFQLRQLWAPTGARPEADTLQIKILRPAIATIPTQQLTYHAIIKAGTIWKTPDATTPALNFEWYLLKLDAFGNGVYLEKLGTGPQITLEIPEDPLTYRLYLIGEKDGEVYTAIGTLNTPWFEIRSQNPGARSQNSKF